MNFRLFLREPDVRECSAKKAPGKNREDDYCASSLIFVKAKVLRQISSGLVNRKRQEDWRLEENRRLRKVKSTTIGVQEQTGYSGTVSKSNPFLQISRDHRIKMTSNPGKRQTRNAE